MFYENAVHPFSFTETKNLIKQSTEDGLQEQVT